MRIKEVRVSPNYSTMDTDLEPHAQRFKALCLEELETIIRDQDTPARDRIAAIREAAEWFQMKRPVAPPPTMTGRSIEVASPEEARALLDGALDSLDTGVDE